MKRRSGWWKFWRECVRACACTVRMRVLVMVVVCVCEMQEQPNAPSHMLRHMAAQQGQRSQVQVGTRAPQCDHMKPYRVMLRMSHVLRMSMHSS